MSVTLRNLIQKVRHMDIKLVAGAQGLDNDVSWIHMVESSPATSFLDGGELAITTGVGIGSDREFMDLITQMYEHKVSGVIINIGPYLPTIPVEVTDFCDAHGLPLFRVPWKTHLSEIIRIMTYTITQEDRHQIESAALFENAISFPDQEELYAVSLRNHGYQASWSYTVCLVRPDAKTASSGDELKKFIRPLNISLGHKWNQTCIFDLDGDIVFVLGNYDKDQVRAFVRDMQIALRSVFPTSYRPITGVGKTTQSIRCLYKSYRQASSVLRLQTNGKVSPDNIYYNDMGIYTLLMNITDRDVLTDFIENTLQPVIDYDEKNDTNLVQILRSYMKNNGSVQATADELFVHRNTVNYRLNKIKELTGMDLSALDTRLKLGTALMILDVI